MKEYYFKCNRWFSREKDDGEIMREIPLYKNGKPILPCKYHFVMVVNYQKYFRSLKYLIAINSN